MTSQSHLLMNKKWYSLEDASRRLSSVLREEVTIKDLVQLVLDDELSVVVHMNLDKAHPVVPEGEGHKRHPSSIAGKGMRPMVIPPAGYEVAWDEQVYLDGAYYLTIGEWAIVGWRKWLLGNERPDEEFFKKYPTVWFLTDIEDGSSIYLACDFFPELPPSEEVKVSVRPPDIAEWVILKSDLDRIVNKQAEVDAGRMHKEMPSHLLAIGALLDLLKNSPRSKHSQTTIIEEIVEQRQIGVRGLKEDTLKKLFSRANEALKEARKDRKP